MKTVKIFRFSGYPVSLENKEKMVVERREVWDKIIERCTGDATRMQKLGERVENILANKYPTVEDVEFCDTPEKSLALQEKYGNIMMSMNTETKELVYCILDAQDSAYV